jgi:glucose-1-phosphate adenylyltransferase
MGGATEGVTSAASRRREQEGGGPVTALRAYGSEPTAPPDAPAKSTLALILAGGRGSRLQELTNWRAKPAIPFGGKFRIIDFALSNCVNSGIRRIGICTQYKSQSLIRHVQRGWSFLDGRFGEFIELLPAQQRVEASWYQGTADAVYQNLDILRIHAPDFVLILAGDHVYKMDYGKMIQEHVASGAQMTIACIQVPLPDARSLGTVCVEPDGQVVRFEEKPDHPTPMRGRPDHALASMGVYVLNAAFLYAELLRDADDATSSHDFGRDLIPRLIAESANVRAHDYVRSCVNMSEGVPYWRDVGTVDAFWEANLALVQVKPELNLYDEDWPIWTYQEQLPPAKFVFDEDARRGTALDSIIGSGCIVSGSTVRRSLLFSKVQVHSFCTIEDSVILPNVEVGRHVQLRRTVVDKHCRLPEGLVVGLDPVEDRRHFRVTDRGVTLIIPEMLGQKIHHLR